MQAIIMDIILLYLHEIKSNLRQQTGMETSVSSIYADKGSLTRNDTSNLTVYAKTSLSGTMECYHQSTAVDVYARHSQEG